MFVAKKFDTKSIEKNSKNISDDFTGCIILLLPAVTYLYSNYYYENNKDWKTIKLINKREAVMASTYNEELIGYSDINKIYIFSITFNTYISTTCIECFYFIFL